MHYDSTQVSLVGHSAGAQLCMMALLHRAAAAHAAASRQAARTAHPDASGTASSTAAPGDTSPGITGVIGVAGVTDTTGAAYALADFRMPKRLIGIAGVYDISKHYEYETDRGVQELSTMKRAIGGLGMAASVSPSVVLGTALHRARKSAVHAAKRQQRDPGTKGPAAAVGGVAGSRPAGGGGLAGRSSDGEGDEEGIGRRFYEEFPLWGEAIAHRIGEYLHGE